MEDRILRVPEIAEKTGKSVDTIQWYRHRQRAGFDEGPRMFKLGRNVVAKESDVTGWVEAQYAASGPVIATDIDAFASRTFATCAHSDA